MIKQLDQAKAVAFEDHFVGMLRSGARDWRTAIFASNPLLAAATAFLRRARRRLRIRADQRHLHTLPDFLLSDIGIPKGQIEIATELGRDYLPMPCADSETDGLPARWP